MKDKIHIVYGTDDNYIFPTMVSAASAVYYAKDRSSIVVHLFDAGVTDAHYDDYCRNIKAISDEVELVRHKLSSDMFDGFGAWKGSVVTYSRMYMAELLPNIDWAIYVDGDTLWLGDPAELWKLRDETKLVLASKDPPTPMMTKNPEFAWYRERGMDLEEAKYLCMGLMLANLKAMRAEDVPLRCREFMTKFPSPRVVDQTVLNFVCQGRSAPLPDNWGVFSVWHKGIDLSRPSIVHYCQDVPWKRHKLNRLFSDVVLLWFSFCREVLGLNELKKFSLFDRVWRRVVFNLLRHVQWLVRKNKFIHSRLRNSHGIPKEQMNRILRSMKGARDV